MPDLEAPDGRDKKCRKIQEVEKKSRNGEMRQRRF
jgi:hypothetical protein